MIEDSEGITQEEISLENGKSIIKYINEDGSLSNKSTATFMCEYIYDNEDSLVSQNIFNNPYINKYKSKIEDISKIRKIHFYLSVDTINKINILADKKNMDKSELITELINKI